MDDRFGLGGDTYIPLMVSNVMRPLWPQLQDDLTITDGTMGSGSLGRMKMSKSGNGLQAIIYNRPLQHWIMQTFWFGHKFALPLLPTGEGVIRWVASYTSRFCFFLSDAAVSSSPAMARMSLSESSTATLNEGDRMSVSVGTSRRNCRITLLLSL
jgi:hypothetical protein